MCLWSDEGLVCLVSCKWYQSKPGDARVPEAGVGTIDTG